MESKLDLPDLVASNNAMSAEQQQNLALFQADDELDLDDIEIVKFTRFCLAVSRTDESRFAAVVY